MHNVTLPPGTRGAPHAHEGDETETMIAAAARTDPAGRESVVLDVPPPVDSLLTIPVAAAG
jgi:uncharacterized RmlC-like cupin family protein